MTTRNSQNPITNQLQLLVKRLDSSVEGYGQDYALCHIIEMLNYFHLLSLYTDTERQAADVQDIYIQFSAALSNEVEETGEPLVNGFQNRVTRAFTHGTHLCYGDAHLSAHIDDAIKNDAYAPQAPYVVETLLTWASCMDLFHGEGFFDCKNMERELYAGIKAIEANPETFGLAGVIQDIDACCKPGEYGDYRRAVFMAVLEAVRFNERL